MTQSSLDERAVASTQTRLKELALVISSNNFATTSLYLRRYEQDVGALPSALADLVTKPGSVPSCAMNLATKTLGGWCGPYWTDHFQGELPFVDSWGRNITYNKAGRQLQSNGINGKDNGGAVDDLVQAF